MEGAIGFVVAHGDQVERARLSWLRSGIVPGEDVLARAEWGQSAEGGWPAFSQREVASIDATCFRLGELDDLGALDRPAARKALRWLAGRQRPDGTWPNDEYLHANVPPDTFYCLPEAARYYPTEALAMYLEFRRHPPAPVPHRWTDDELNAARQRTDLTAEKVVSAIEL